MKNKIAIIGNGFDLAHNLKTSYKNFIDAYSDNEYIVKFKSLKKIVDNYKENCFDFNDNNIDLNDDNPWYSIEDFMKEISLACFAKNFSSEYLEGEVIADMTEVYNNIENEMMDINLIFEKVKLLFIEYLNENVNSVKIEKIKSVEKVLDNQTIAIDFNYTDTIEEYISNYRDESDPKKEDIENIIYIHGSIKKDEDIILGFWTNDTPDSIGSSYVNYSKEILKEILSFKRNLRDGCNKKLIEEFKYVVINYLFSGYGKYPIDEKTGRVLKDYDRGEISSDILKYAQKYKYDIAKLDINYDNIEEIIILGHSMKGDSFYFENLFSNLKNLKRIKLFKYQGEDINYKLDFLKKYSNNIEIILF